LLSVFLPGLLFEAAAYIGFKQLRRKRVAILSRTLPGVMTAIALRCLISTPVANTFVQDFSWKHALLFSAIISATVPIAVVAIFACKEVRKHLPVYSMVRASRTRSGSFATFPGANPGNRQRCFGCGATAVSAYQP
jgi:hypothetical protein